MDEIKPLLTRRGISIIELLGVGPLGAVECLGATSMKLLALVTFASDIARASALAESPQQLSLRPH